MSTVQGEVEAAISTIIGQVVVIKIAGRTDAGVHASGQIIAFDCDWQHSTAALWRAINAKLPRDIALQNLEIAPTGFHPRFDASSRYYVYQFYDAPVRDPLRDHMHWYTGYTKLNLAVMQQAAKMLHGIHDFATFGQPTQGEVTIRNCYRAEVEAVIPEGSYHFHIVANGFLKRMVRSIMGTLVEVGQGKMAVSEFAEAFHAAERSRAGQTAPPHGLILKHISYSEDDLAGE